MRSMKKWRYSVKQLDNSRRYFAAWGVLEGAKGLNKSDPYFSFRHCIEF